MRQPGKAIPSRPDVSSCSQWFREGDWCECSSRLDGPALGCILWPSRTCQPLKSPNRTISAALGKQAFLAVSKVNAAGSPSFVRDHTSYLEELFSMTWSRLDRRAVSLQGTSICHQKCETIQYDTDGNSVATQQKRLGPKDSSGAMVLVSSAGERFALIGKSRGPLVCAPMS